MGRSDSDTLTPRGGGGQEAPCGGPGVHLLQWSVGGALAQETATGGCQLARGEQDPVSRRRLLSVHDLLQGTFAHGPALGVLEGLSLDTAEEDGGKEKEDCQELHRTV